MIDLKWILDALPVGVWVGKVPGGEVTYANPMFPEVLGLEPVPGLGIAGASAAYGIFDRAGNPFPSERFPFSLVVATGRPAVVDDLVIHRPDGRRVNVRAFGHPVLDSEGKLAHVVVAFTDITQEVKSVAERSEVEARLAIAIDHSPIVVWAIDRTGNVTLSEGAGLTRLGVKSGQMVGQNVFDLYRDHPTIPGHFRRGLLGEEQQYTAAVGDVVYETWLAPVRDAAGEVTGVAGLSTDVTEFRALQTTVIQNDRVAALGTLAASVAHEINNPLTYMLGHAAMAQEALERADRLLAADGPVPTGEVRDVVRTLGESLEPLRAGIERIALVTRELHTFARPDSAGETALDLREVAQSVLRLVGKEVEARARLVTELGETAPVRGNAARLVQVVLNLVVNAMQALPSSRAQDHEIAVRTRMDGARVILEVDDSGPGVPEELRERIFEPFFSTKDVGQGSGLGLFVCRNLVRGHGGEVSIDDRPGGGARFRISLPADPTAPREKADPAAAPTARGARLLVIDDEPEVARSLCRRLTSAGFRAETEQDAARALDLLAREGSTFDLIFCDLMMSGMTGMELAEELGKRDPATAGRLVFMTGGAFTPRARDFQQSHLDRVVDKPFDIVAETERRLGR